MWNVRWNVVTLVLLLRLFSAHREERNPPFIFALSFLFLLGVETRDAGARLAYGYG